MSLPFLAKARENVKERCLWARKNRITLNVKTQALVRTLGCGRSAAGEEKLEAIMRRRIMKPLGYFLAILLVGLVNIASAGTSTWTGAGADALWCTAENWDPEIVPGLGDDAVIDDPNNPCVIDCDAYCGSLTVGLNNAGCSLNMVSGSLSVGTDLTVGKEAGSSGTMCVSDSGSVTVDGHIEIGDMGAGCISCTDTGVIYTHTFGMCTGGGTATMDISGGGLNVTTDMDIGGAGGTATVNMTGGPISVGGHMEIGGPMHCTAQVNLNRGVINTHTFGMCAGGGIGTMDVGCDGVLTVDGDATAQIQGYVSDGWITCPEPECSEVSVDYNNINPGKTTAKCSKCETAWNPIPMDGASCVDPDVQLSWSPGYHASRHNVYFGNSPSSLTLVSAGQSSNQFDPGTLELGENYFWRIDEVNDVEPNSPWIGNIWSFTVAPGYLILDCFAADANNNPDPLGDRYSMDIILSNGEWTQEFCDVNHVEIGAPETLTCQISYEWGNSLFTIRPELKIEKGETARYQLFAYDHEGLVPREEMYVVYREVDANESVSNVWDANSMTLYTTTSGNPGKGVGFFCLTGSTSTDHSTDPIYTCEALSCNVDIDACICGSKTWVDWLGNVWWVYAHAHASIHYSNANASTISTQFAAIDGTTNGQMGIYDIYYNDAIVNNSKQLCQETTLRNVDTGETVSPQYYYPQYAAPGGNYILELPESIPGEFAQYTMPLQVSNGYGQAPSIYMVGKDALAPYTFGICAEEPFVEASFSNLQHDQTGHKVSVDVSTETPSCWWGVFVVPDNLAVKKVSAIEDANSTELQKDFDYTTNRVCDFNLVVVRIAPSTDRLELTYCTLIPGDINEDCCVNFLDFAVLAEHWLEVANGGS